MIYKAYLKMILAMSLWGTIGVFVLFSKLDSVTLTFCRCALGMSIFLFFLNKSFFEKLKTYTLKQYLLILFSSALIVVNWIFLFKSFQLSSITLGNIAYYTQPVFLLFLSYIFLNEKISFIKWILVLITFLGMVLTVNIHLADFNVNRMMLLGIVLALFAGIFYAGATILVKKIHEVSSESLTFFQLLIGTVLLLPFLQINVVALTALQMKCILIITVFHTVLAYLLYYSALKDLSMLSIAILSYLDPVVAIFSDILFFHRELCLIQWVGIALTLTSSYLLITSKNLFSSQKLQTI